MTDVGLGIDLGLTGVRVGLVRVDGEVLARATAPTGDARTWAAAVAKATRSALAEGPPGARVVAIAAAGAGPQPIPVDERLDPLLPSVLTALDHRPTAERDRLASQCGLTADALIDHAAPVMHWWREHARDAFDRAAHALDATGFLVAWLTGRPVMDRITRDDYVLPGLEPPLPIPAAGEPLDVAGRLGQTAAAALGVDVGVPVALGTYDSWVDLESMGGTSRILLGSTMILTTESRVARSDAGDLRSVVLPGGERAISGWTSAAGSTIAWARDRFGGEDIAGLEPGAGGLLALPYLAGERTPVWDPEARGIVVGLTTATSAAQLGRAFLDAVALSARDIVERIRERGHATATWRVAGGGIHDSGWLQATSDALAAELEVVDTTGGVGAAVFALRATGHHPAVPVIRRISPHAPAARRYDDLYPLYRELYAPLRTTMAALAGLDGYQ